MAKVTRRVAALVALTMGSVLVSAVPARADVPANDDFADAIFLSGVASSVVGTNVDATSEPGELCPVGFCGENSLRSVWYEWTASTSDFVTFGLCLSDFDTTMAVFTGSAVDSLTLVTANDDRCLGGGQSEAHFVSVPGTTYYIQVGGLDGRSGAFRLTYPTSAVPVEDTDGDGLTDEEDPDTIGAVVADSSTAIAAGNRKAFLGRLDEVEFSIVASDTASAIADLGLPPLRLTLRVGWSQAA